jgi:hypothetical protein
MPALLTDDQGSSCEHQNAAVGLSGGDAEFGLFVIFASCPERTAKNEEKVREYRSQHRSLDDAELVLRECDDSNLIGRDFLAFREV